MKAAVALIVAGFLLGPVVPTSLDELDALCVSFKALVARFTASPAPEPPRIDPGDRNGLNPR